MIEKTEIKMMCLKRITVTHHIYIFLKAKYYKEARLILFVIYECN